MTLSAIADLIAGKLNDPFNFILTQRIKDSVKLYRSLFIRRDFERNPASGQYTQKIVMELISVDVSEDCKKLTSNSCYILRTKEKIKVARLNSNSDFMFVGDRNFKHAWAEASSAGLEFMGYTKFKAPDIIYEHLNNYIYVYNNPKLKYIGVKAVFDDLDTIQNLCLSEGNCYADDEEFPISGDMLALIVDQIYKDESGVLLKEAHEAEINVLNKQ